MIWVTLCSGGQRWAVRMLAVPHVGDWIVGQSAGDKDLRVVAVEWEAVKTPGAGDRTFAPVVHVAPRQP